MEEKYIITYKLAGVIDVTDEVLELDPGYETLLDQARAVAEGIKQINDPSMVTELTVWQPVPEEQYWPLLICWTRIANDIIADAADIKEQLKRLQNVGNVADWELKYFNTERERDIFVEAVRQSNGYEDPGFGYLEPQKSKPK